MSAASNQVMLDKAAMLEALITDRAGWPKRRSDCYGSCDRHNFARLAVVAGIPGDRLELPADLLEVIRPLLIVPRPVHPVKYAF